MSTIFYYRGQKYLCASTTDSDGQIGQLGLCSTPIIDIISTLVISFLHSMAKYIRHKGRFLQTVFLCAFGSSWQFFRFIRVRVLSRWINKRCWRNRIGDY